MIDYTQHNLWPTPVYQSRIELQDKWLEFSKTCEYERMETDNGDISKDRYILDSMDLKNDIQDHVNNFVRDWLRVDKKAEFYFTNSWMVRHNKKDWSGMHFHANSLISGVYYIDIPEDSGDIKFHNHFHKSVIPDVIKLDYTDKNFVNSEVVAFKVKPGDILIFPSGLQHSVTENITNNRRYSLAFNCFVRGDLGKLEYSLKLR
jgi:uncharacterized protein (TIGR02466 family)